MDVKSIKPSFSDERGSILDIVTNDNFEYATIIHSKKHSVRANHYHKETYQYVYVLNGRMRVVSQMPDEEKTEAVLGAGDLILNVPHERHAFEALEDTDFLVLTRGPRGGEDYESDTFRLTEPLIERPAK